MIYTYIAKNGVVVTTPDPDRSSEEDFPTILHYLRWSYGAWGSKIFNDVRAGFSEKFSGSGIGSQS